MTVEHNAKSWLECKKILRWFDKNIGTEYEVDADTNTLMFFGLDADEFWELMNFLKENNYVK